MCVSIRLGAGGEGDDRGWDGWMASLTRWTWVWVNSGSWWWTGRPGVLRFMGSQRAGHNWVTELNWTEHIQSLHNMQGTVLCALCKLSHLIFIILTFIPIPILETRPREVKRLIGRLHCDFLTVPKPVSSHRMTLSSLCSTAGQFQCKGWSLSETYKCRPKRELRNPVYQEGI